MDLLEGELDAQRARQTQMQQELGAQRDTIEFLRQLVLNQQQAFAQQAQAQQNPQPQQPAGPTNGQVVGELQRLVGSMVVTQVLTNIKPFGGDPKDYRRWIKDVERHIQAVGGGDDNRIAVAVQSSKGVVADFLFRYRTDHPGATWQNLKDELATRFSDVIDAAHALAQLRRMKQAANESVTVFAERLLDRAADAFVGEQLDQPLIARQLIDAYTDGLLDNQSAKKILRENPQTFAGAVDLAVAETRFAKKCEARKRGPESTTDRHEPMEIGSVEQKKKDVTCYNCKKVGHIAKNCRAPKQEVGPCFRCKKMGHLKKDCRVNLNQGNGQ